MDKHLKFPASVTTSGSSMNANLTELTKNIEEDHSRVTMSCMDSHVLPWTHHIHSDEIFLHKVKGHNEGVLEPI